MVAATAEVPDGRRGTDDRSSFTRAERERERERENSTETRTQPLSDGVERRSREDTEGEASQGKEVKRSRESHCDTWR